MSDWLERTGDLIRSATPRRARNILLNKLEKRRGAPVPKSYPILLDVILTKACNLDCTFCISSTVRENRWLDYGLYERIAEELFPTAYRVMFCSGGEPLLYPQVREALQLAKRHHVRTTMVSNGMLLKEDVVDWMLRDQSVDRYIISCDGSTKETLERIRRGAKFDRIIENVSRLSRNRDTARKRFPKIGLRYSVMKSNAEDLPGIAALARLMGVDRVEVSYVNFANDMTPEDSLFFHQAYAADVFTRTRAKAHEYGVEVRLPPLPRDDTDGKRCGAPWDFAQIDTDGSIRFCYMAWIQTVGNFDDGFDAVWRGEDYRKIRETLHTDTPYFPYCAFCSQRNGCGDECAHNQSLHSDAYTFEGADSDLAFNKRRDENREAFHDMRETPEEEPVEVK